MQKRRLGRSDLLVSSICLGTMTWGQQNTEAEGHEQLDFAFERGVNFLDTAEMYSIPPRRETQGSTERIIGSWLKKRGRRDDVIIASKVIGRTSSDWYRGGRPSKLVRADIMDAIDKSLARLGTDYIDLYQIHFPDRLGRQPHQSLGMADASRHRRDADRRNARRLRRSRAIRENPPSGAVE
jgi:aryl-alcohol dehydrogenase-like predicted oxidoreductase